MNHLIEIRSLNLKPGMRDEFHRLYKGPREAILALIENYTDIVFEVDEVTLQGLRR